MRRELVLLVIGALIGLAFLLYPKEKCVTVYSLAYYEGSGYAVPVEVCAKQGTGRVFLNIDRQYDYVFQESLKNVASLFNSRHLPLYDFTVSLGKEGVTVSGASASLAVYAGMYLAYEGKSIGPTAFSGFVSTDGRVLPVEHVYDKVEGFGGSVVLPEDVCTEGAVCVSSVEELEEWLGK